MDLDKLDQIKTQVNVKSDIEVLTEAVIAWHEGKVPPLPIEMLQVLKSLWMNPELLAMVETHNRENPAACAINMAQIGLAIGVRFMQIKIKEAVDLGMTVMPQLLADDELGTENKRKVN